MKNLLIFALLLSAVGGCTYWGVFSDGAKRAMERDRARDRAQAAADATPHVIREADGCKVYAFRADSNWHYFTRCPDGTVTTERNWTESRRQGKQTITEHKSETIVTSQGDTR
ncbi:hypothetical protein DF052_00350 [Burkholderia glumae]|uniref:hypothetical protein n=1 Tax=Burkholderia glumae TaxID=337 RepID=UPI000F5F82BF|nr:hypothetical protein [Burkholderia glumae]RQZ76439.1 hypothetical protein DF052_00350 [Burkholderia glumae]